MNNISFNFLLNQYNKTVNNGTHYVFVEYDQTTAKYVIKVKKAASKLVAAKNTFKAKAKIKKYTIALKDNNKVAVQNVKVTLKVNGKTYNAITNSKGKATFNIKNLNKNGIFNAIVKFAGNNYYNAASKSVKIVVKK